MLIYVQSPQKREFIKELMDGQTFSDVKFTFEKMDGMKIYFSFEGDVDAEAAAKIAKSAVKASKYGQILYFTTAVAK